MKNKTRLIFKSMVAKSSHDPRTIGLLRPENAYEFYQHETPVYIHVTVTHAESRLHTMPVSPIKLATKPIVEGAGMSESPIYVTKYKPIEDTMVLTRQKLLDNRAIFNLFDTETDHIGLTYDKKRDAIVVIDLKHIVAYCNKSGYSHYEHPYYNLFARKRGVEKVELELKNVKHPDKSAARIFNKSIRYIPLPKLNQLEYTYKTKVTHSLVCQNGVYSGVDKFEREIC